jgi:hypothetical protein
LTEAFVSSLGNQGPEHRGTDWLAVARTLLIQAFVLLALSGAFVLYLRWSSDANWAEFISAGPSPVPDAKDHQPSPAPVQTVRGKAVCERKG